MSKLLNVREAAQRAAVSAGLVRAWVNGGELPHYRLGRKGSRKSKIAIAEADLDAFLASRRVDAVPSPSPAQPAAHPAKGDDFSDYYRKVMDEIARKRRR